MSGKQGSENYMICVKSYCQLEIKPQTNNTTTSQVLVSISDKCTLNSTFLVLVKQFNCR